MAIRQHSKSYSYHFFNSQTKNERPLSTYLENGDLPEKQHKFHYKFFEGFQENTTQTRNPETDLSKFALLKEKIVHPIKKYTFSGLTKFPKDFRKTENIGQQSQLASAQSVLKNVERPEDGIQTHKKSIENQEELLNACYVKSDFQKEEKVQENRKISKIRELQQKVKQLTFENELFRVRTEEYKKLNDQHLQTEKRLNCEISAAYQTIGRQQQKIDSLCESKEANKKKIDQLLEKLATTSNSKNPLNIISGVVKESILLQKAPQEKTIEKEDCLKVEQKSYFEEYQQIVKKFGFELSEGNCHQMLITFLEEAQKSFEEVHQHRGRIEHFDKQKNKMVHTLKKHEAEIAKLCQENHFLSNELNRNVHLVSEYNEQIALLHLKNLDQRFSSIKIDDKSQSFL